MIEHLLTRDGLEALLCRWPRAYALALHLLRPGNYERELFLRILRRGDVVLDIGANFGDYTILCANTCGPQGTIHAFEPVPASFATLQRRVETSCRFGNVRLSRLAVSDRSGGVSLYIPGSDLGQASLRTHEAGSWLSGSGTEVVPAHATTLDDYTRSWDSGPDFLKIDVEGAELLVLHGGSATLRKWRPLVQLEVYSGWTRDFGYAPRDLVRYLVEHGYDRFFVAEANLTPLDNPESDIQSLGESSNIICANTQAHGERLRRVLPKAQWSASR